MKLLRNSLGLFTDSGGLQKEAFWSKTPCITLRNETEWTETVDLGVNVVAGANVVDRLPAIAHEIVSNRREYEEKFSSAANPYAVSGHRASQVVADELRPYAE
jgi:UDP-N-acetylglucosamine 2-epimerase